MNPSSNNCPHCGAERIAHPLDKNHTILDCGSVEGWRTPLCHEREAHNKTKWENVKLRELLHDAADDLQHWDETVRAKAQRELYDFLEKETRLAPAPEEPVIQENRITEPVSEGTRIAAEARAVCNNLTSEEREKAREKANEVMDWRELGSGEVIQEGDEFDPCHLYKKEWVPVRKEWIGTKVTGSEYEVRFRTRRPLCTNDAPKQEEKWIPANPPLEKELNYIEHRGTSLPDSRRYIADAIRYLRDEIQKLKTK